MMMNKTLRTQLDDDGVLTVTFDAQDKSVNTFSPLALEELDAVVASLESGEQKPAGVIFTSAKPDVFVTGADVFEMSKMDGEQIQAFLAHGQTLFDRIAKLPMPTVAARPRYWRATTSRSAAISWCSRPGIISVARARMARLAPRRSPPFWMKW